MLYVVEYFAFADKNKNLHLISTNKKSICLPHLINTKQKTKKDKIGVELLKKRVCTYIYIYSRE